MNKKAWLVITSIAVATVLFLASSCTASINNPPVIGSLQPETEQVVPSGAVQVMCTASDPDGDQLSYDWSASAGEVSGDGNTATWTAPASEGSYSVTVQVSDGRGGEVTDHVTIAVRVNNPPTIASLTADPATATPSSSVQVTCVASDPDGDGLTYEWAATAGSISGAGSVVSWIAPQEVGTYSITVVVADAYGGEVTESVSLGVGTAPTIEQLCITPRGHIYLRESTTLGCDYDVWANLKYDIECVASNTGDEPSYNWSCTAGNISGSGSSITWTAPNETSVNATISVTVSGIADISAAESMILHVPSCACGYWGLQSGCK